VPGESRCFGDFSEIKDLFEPAVMKKIPGAFKKEEGIVPEARPAGKEKKKSRGKKNREIKRIFFEARQPIFLGRSSKAEKEICKIGNKKDGKKEKGIGADGKRKPKNDSSRKNIPVLALEKA